MVKQFCFSACGKSNLIYCFNLKKENDLEILGKGGKNPREKTNGQRRGGSGWKVVVKVGFY
jgi:hypothetical protein